MASTCRRRLWGLVNVAAASEIPVVLIDGGSGSGKTTLAHELAAAGPADTLVLSMDAFYPGWDGLAAASRMVVDDILDASSPGYWRWDWEQDRRSAWEPVDISCPLVIEGCGALTPEARELATLGIWLDVDADTRKERALARDGDAFAPHWDRWAAQEQAHWDAHRPWELADVVLRG